MFTDKTLQNIEKVLTYLENNNIEFVIAGGFPRDLAHGVRPKDIDIFVLGLEGGGDDILTKSGGLVELLKTMEGKNKPCSGEGNPNILSVMGVEVGERGSELGMDVIWMKDKIKTSAHLLATFDYNINQYVLEKDSNGDYSVPVFKGVGEKSLMIVDRGNKPKRDRKIKILQKANDFGWELPYVTLDRLIPY